MVHLVNGVPTTVEPPKKRLPAMDRGLVRVVVRTYANIQGITYEDAHQILRNSKPAVEGATMTPGKWEASRTETYRRVQYAKCQAQYRKTRDKFAVPTVRKLPENG